MADIPGFLHVFAAFHRPLDMVDQRTPSSMTLTWDVTWMKSWAVFFKAFECGKANLEDIYMGYL